MTRANGALGAISLAMVMAAVPAQAQIAGARELVAGQVAAGAPSKVRAPEIYYFTGEAGAKLTFALSSNDTTRLVLYAPTGEEMLSAGGDGGATLEAVLPLSDAYTVAVIRRDAAQPYTLFMTTTLPTVGEARLALGVGYEALNARDERVRRCWVKPGLSSRVNFLDAPPGDTRSLAATLGADRNSISYKGNSSYVLHFRIDGADLVEGMEYSSGRKGEERRTGFTVETFSQASLGYKPRFTGYFCEP